MCPLGGSIDGGSMHTNGRHAYSNFIVRHLWNGIQSMHDLDIVWDGRVQLPEKGATPTIKHDVYAIMLL